MNAAAAEEAQARAKLDEVLTSRQVVLVTGKGGVGKSVVSATLALRARALGLKPLLFECDAPKRPSLFAGGKAATREVSEIAPGILGINQDSDEAVRDYAAAALPSKALAELLFENRISRLFLRAAPSVMELGLVGRVAMLADKYGADGPIIVDLHATGHALNLLRAPAGIMKVLGSGPVFERAKKVEELLLDPKRTALVTVALPEELPVTELLELLDKLRDLKAPQGPILLNGVFSEPAPGINDDVLAHLGRGAGVEAASAAGDLRALRVWARRCAREGERLREGVRAKRGTDDVIALPYLFDDSSAFDLSGRLCEQLANRTATAARAS